MDSCGDDIFLRAGSNGASSSGGGMYVQAQSADSTIRFVHCTVDSTFGTRDIWHGAPYLLPWLYGALFAGGLGGGLFVVAIDANSTVQFERCSVSNCDGECTTS